MLIVLEIIASLCAVLGGLGLFFTVTASQSAPQEAAGAAISIGLAVIPYCFVALYQRRVIIDLQKKLLPRADAPEPLAEGATYEPYEGAL